jgi:CubicO group peptidase (beta-lactamase class C family)
MRGFDAQRIARLRPWLEGRVADGIPPGAVVLVARDDEVHIVTAGVQDVAAGTRMRADTIFRMLSMTKAVIAAAAVMLIEEGAIALDDAVERWLPEMADRRVLRTLDAPLDDTVPAARPVTLRDLLTFRFGLGVIFAPPGTSPIAAAMAEAGVAPGPEPIRFGPDEYMRRIGTLPLACQPGERWMYHTGIDLVAVLLARVTGQKLDALLEERILGPLGMADTGFHVPEGKMDRFATGYRLGEDGLVVHDPARDGAYARPPLFPNALVSTASDYHLFCRMLLDGGRGPGGGRMLSRAGVALMMTDQITPEQKARSAFSEGFWDNTGWGLGGGVVTRRDGVGTNPGTYGWTGGFGTAFLADPGEGLIALCLTQRLMRAPDDMALARDFFTMAYAALN